MFFSLMLTASVGCTGENHEPLASLPSVAPVAAAASFLPDKGDFPADVPADQPQWAWLGYRPWKYIVIHHSASPSGNAKVFDRAHRARGYDELGYHFVITNGNGGADGNVEVGGRWRIQKWGSHTGRTPGNEYNNYGIGICLVGNFDSQMPSDSQLDALADLAGFLMKRFDIPSESIIGHRDAPGQSTACPGGNLREYVRGGLRARLDPVADKTLARR